MNKYLLVTEKFFLLRFYTKNCASIKNDRVYFFSKSFTDYGYYYLKRLYKNNKIIHIQDPGCDIYTFADGRAQSFRSILILIYKKILLGKDIVYGSTGIKQFQKFFKNG